MKEGKTVDSYPPSPVFPYLPNYNSEFGLERAQTSRASGIVVALGDGGTRTFGSSIDATLWVRINDPRDGYVVTIE